MVVGTGQSAPPRRGAGALHAKPVAGARARCSRPSLAHFPNGPFPPLTPASLAPPLRRACENGHRTPCTLHPHLVMPAKAGIALQLVRLRRSLRVEQELSSACGSRVTFSWVVVANLNLAARSRVANERPLELSQASCSRRQLEKSRARIYRVDEAIWRSF